MMFVAAEGVACIDITAHDFANEKYGQESAVESASYHGDKDGGVNACDLVRYIHKNSCSSGAQCRLLLSLLSTSLRHNHKGSGDSS